MSDSDSKTQICIRTPDEPQSHQFIEMEKGSNDHKESATDEFVDTKEEIVFDNEYDLLIARAEAARECERKLRKQEIEKYKDVKRDLSFICRMVEENNRTMEYQIAKELITDENYKYLDRDCFSHSIQMAYVVCYKKALDEAKLNQGNISDPLVDKLETFKKSVPMGTMELVTELLKRKGLLRLDAEFCCKIFVWFHAHKTELDPAMYNLAIVCLDQSYKIDGYDGDRTTNIPSILDDKELLELVNIIVPSEHDFHLWLLEMDKRKLAFIDAIKGHAKVPLMRQLLTIIRSEKLHSDFIVEPYRRLIKNMIAIDDYQVRELLSVSLNRNFTVFAEDYLSTINAQACDQVMFSSPFSHTLYERAYHQKNERIMKYCKPPPNFEQNKWKLGFLDLVGDIDLTITERRDEKWVQFSTNSEYSFDLVDIVDNVARFVFAVVDSGFVTLAAIMGTIPLPSSIVGVKIQTIRISRPKLSFTNWNGNQRLSDTLFLLKTDQDQAEIVYFRNEFHTISTSKDKIDFMTDNYCRTFAIPWGGGGGCFGAKLLDKPNDLRTIIPELRDKFKCYEVKADSELEGRLWAVNRCGVRNHGGTIWMLFNQDFSRVKVGENIFSDYKYPMVCDRIEVDGEQVSLDLRVDSESIIGNDKTEIVYHKVLNLNDAE